MYGDTTHATLVCLIAAIDDIKMSKDMTLTMKHGDAEERTIAHFVDRFMSEAIEAGLIDMYATWGTPAWQEALEEVHPELETVE